MTTTAITLNAQQSFPVGTSVKAYPRSNWSQAQLPPIAAVGTEEATATVASDGTLAFTGLVAKRTYFACATVGGEFRYIAFTVGDNVDLAGASDDMPLSMLDTDSTMAANSDSKVPSQKAVKTAIAASSGAAPDASTTVKGISKLSVAPASAPNPIAVGDNDPRVPSQIDTDGTLAANSDARVASQKATKTYADAIASGLTIKGSVRLATAAALATNTRTGNVLTAVANGALSVDGVSPAVGDRILVKNEVAGANNGAYVVTVAGAVGAAWVLTRASDADTSAEIQSGTFFFVGEGTTNGGSGWVLTTADPITLNTTALTFTQFSGAGEITAGSGLTKTGNTLAADFGSASGKVAQGNDARFTTVPANNQTADYTLVLTDAGKCVEVNSASAKVVTVPTNASVAYATDTVIELFRQGAGTVTVAPAGGVTIRSPGGLLALRVQYSSAALRKRGTDEWVLSGDLV